MRDVLQNRLFQRIRELHGDGIVTFYAGGALGFDTLSAEAVLKYRAEHPDVRLVIAIPCENQADRWKPEDIARYQEIRRAADESVCLSKRYDRECMRRRNRFMVDHSAVCVCYLTRERSGTAKTVRYAEEQGLRIINLAAI